MKTLIKVLVASLILFSLTVHANDESKAGVHGKDKGVFILKTTKKFVGAKVEVFKADGELIAYQNLEKRKVVIDFRDVRLGTYTIRVTKGNAREEYQFIKQ
ncbi:MAG TPA: T9SS type A sorting domain-containing protein [Ohtaekwangia sp.]